ncbi:MAG: hypothetical protein K0R68_16 [Mycobacterium sp.]|jgi:hypothetical protein|nr:hypothetical protein [Mycobacterium sp.]
MPTFDMASHRGQHTTLGAVAAALPWESELSELAKDDPAFADAAVILVEGDLDIGDQNLDLDGLYPRDPDRALPFLLLVRGSLRARAVLSTDLDGGTHLVVLGDLEADMVLTIDQETFVGGDLRLRRAWWGVGESGRLMVRGTITAPALIVDGYRVDDERIQRRHGVVTTAFLWSDVTDHLPRTQVRCVLDDAFVVDEMIAGSDEDEAEDVGDWDAVSDWVDIVDVLEAISAGADPFADPITDPSHDLFVPEPALLACSANEVFTLFQSDVSAEALAAVFTDPLVSRQCRSYDDDLIDRDRKYSVRQASQNGSVTVPARLTIMRVLSDPAQMYRFHHFEARESPSGATHVELLTQHALGTDEAVVPVAPHDIDHYIDALSCFRRLRSYLAETSRFPGAGTAC